MADAEKPTANPAQEALIELVRNVSVNPAAVSFPADQWGNTSELKKAVLKAASQVRGQKDKHDILVGTLHVLLAHIKKRFDGDVEARALYAAQLREQEAGRAHLEHNTGRLVQDGVTEVATVPA